MKLYTVKIKTMEKTATLIMLDKPILVSDEEIKDWYVHNQKGVGLRMSNSKAIPMDAKNILAGHEGTKRLTFNITDEEAKRIGWIDVEEVAKQWYTKSFSIESDWYSCVKGIELGLSLTPKKYTDDEVFVLIQEAVYESQNNPNFNMTKYLERLSQPKQFQVSYAETENEVTITKIL